MSNSTGNVSKSKWARASMTALLAGAMIVGVGASASAHDEHWRGHWGRGWPHHEWRGPYYGGWYRPHYYAPPVVAYPPAYGYYGYYGPPSLNLNFDIPL